MGSPLMNVIVFVAFVAIAVALWWPGVGLLRGTKRAGRERVLTEDALKHIYHGERQGYTVSVQSVAGALEVSQARAVELADKMGKAGLVSLVDGRLLLTEEGKRYALQIIRAHRLWERYLADETGVDPTEWHSIAERREHVMTPDETNKLATKLGHPRFDPHGDPIPTAGGAVPKSAVVPLSKLDAGDRAYVVHIEDEPEVVYAQLMAMGMYLGMVLTVNARSEERIVCEGDGRALALAPLLAANVSIQRLDPAEAVAREGSALTLAAIEPGDVVEVDHVSRACRGIERRRLMDLGIVPGTRIEFERRGLSGGLSAYRVRGTVIALREEQASMIAVKRIQKVTG